MFLERLNLGSFFSFAFLKLIVGIKLYLDSPSVLFLYAIVCYLLGILIGFTINSIAGVGFFILFAFFSLWGILEVFIAPLVGGDE